MEREGKFVKIPNNMIVGEETLIKKYGDKSLLVWIYLQKHLTLRDKCYITLANCIEESGYKLNNHKGKTNEQFRNILIDFKKEGIINTDTDLEKVKINDLIICTVKKVEDKFFTIYDCELDKIIEYDKKEDKLNLLKVFCEIESRRHKNEDNVNPQTYSEYEVAFPSYIQICQDTCISSQDSIKKYIDILVELKLIIVGNNGDRVNTITGEVKRDNNTYALANDRGESSLRGALRLFKQKNLENGWEYKTFKDHRSLGGEKKQILKRIKQNNVTKKDIKRLEEINNILEKNKYKTTEQEEREIEDLM